MLKYYLQDNLYGRNTSFYYNSSSGVYQNKQINKVYYNNNLLWTAKGSIKPPSPGPSPEPENIEANYALVDGAILKQLHSIYNGTIENININYSLPKEINSNVYNVTDKSSNKIVYYYDINNTHGSFFTNGEKIGFRNLFNLFYNCCNLDMNLDDYSFRNIDNGIQAFYNCHCIHGNAWIDPNVNNTYPYWYSSFNNCYNIIGLYFNNREFFIGGYGFGNCFNLKYITLGKRVTGFGFSSVVGSFPRSKEYVNFFNFNFDLCKNTLVNLGSYGSFFGGCDKINKAWCGPAITNMYNAYYGCPYITKAVCGPNVTNMDYAYANCANLKYSAPIEDNVVSTYYTYDNCPNLIDLFVGGKSCKNTSYSGVMGLASNSKKISRLFLSPYLGNLYYASPFGVFGNLAPMEIPPLSDNLIDLTSAFTNQSYIYGKAQVGNNTIYMDYSYADCLNLQYASCGINTVSFNGTYIRCIKITEAVCGPNVKYMYSTYYGCNNLTQAACGPNVKYMTSAYMNCYNLKEPVCGENVIDMTGAYMNCYNLKEPVCGENVIDMTNAYYSCNNLVYAVCGNNVVNMIETYYNCTNISKPACGPNVVNMANAYANCYNLKEAVCGDNIIDMTGTYYGCNNLVYAVCGNNVKYMYSTYYGCNNLIYAACGPNITSMNNTYRNLKNLAIAACGDNVINMNNTYENCYNLTIAACGNNVKIMDNTYANCHNLKEAVCGPSVTDMSHTYENCYSLTTAYFDNNVRNAYWTYEHCYNLNYINAFNCRGKNNINLRLMIHYYNYSSTLYIKDKNLNIYAFPGSGLYNTIVKDPAYGLFDNYNPSMN